MNDPLKKHIDKNRKAFDIKEPPAFMWDNIQSSIPNLQQENKEEEIKNDVKKFTIKPIYYGIAASVLVLFLAYFGIKSNSIEKDILPKSVVKSNPIEKESRQEILGYDSILDLEEEKLFAYTEKHSNIKGSNSSNLVVEVVDTISSSITTAQNLIQDTISVSNRIKGIAMLDEGNKLSKDDLKLLRKLSLNDANSVVRLNALEVLSKNIDKYKISAELTSIFLEQNDAMVQLELINMIKSINPEVENPNLIKKLQEIILDTRSNPFLKDEAYVVLLEKNIL